MSRITFAAALYLISALASAAENTSPERVGFFGNRWMWTVVPTSKSATDKVTIFTTGPDGRYHELSIVKSRLYPIIEYAADRKLGKITTGDCVKLTGSPHTWQIVGLGASIENKMSTQVYLANDYLPKVHSRRRVASMDQVAQKAACQG